MDYQLKLGRLIVEALKARYNQGKTANLYFYRDSNGQEIDLLYKSGRELTGIEIKSSSTWNNNFKKTLNNFSNKQATLSHRYVVYSGENRVFSDGLEVMNYTLVGKVFE